MEGAVTLVTQGVILITAAIGLIVSLRNRKAIQEVHLSVNSRLDQLVKLTEVAAFAEGVKSEKDNPSA